MPSYIFSGLFLHISGREIPCSHLHLFQHHHTSVCHVLSPPEAQLNLSFRVLVGPSTHSWLLWYTWRVSFLRLWISLLLASTCTVSLSGSISQWEERRSSMSSGVLQSNILVCVSLALGALKMQIHGSCLRLLLSQSPGKALRKCF